MSTQSGPQIVKRFDNGDTQVECDSADLQNALYTEFYESGARKCQYRLREGVIEGPLTTWYESGKLVSIANLRSGSLDGEVIEWRPDGTLYQVVSFKSGIRSGSLIEWYGNGRVRRCGSFVDNVKDGLWILFGEDGRKLVEEKWEQGKCTARLPEIPPEKLPDDWPRLPGQKEESGPETSPQWKVTFKQSGKTATWDGACKSLLELAEKNGVDIPFACRNGTDGICIKKIVSGRVVYADQPSCEQSDGDCVPCVAVPGSDIVIDA